MIQFSLIDLNSVGHKSYNGQLKTRTTDSINKTNTGIHSFEKQKQLVKIGISAIKK